jgi:4-hydroxy-tetrahydrodipicolinate reductase
MTIKVAVVGAGGKMGTAVCAAVTADPTLQLVAAVDPFAVGQERSGMRIVESLDAITAAGADVAVDFTVAAAGRTTLPWLGEHGIHAVVGTTGFTDADLDGFRSAFTRSNLLIAANFAIGAVLMMRFAELAAPFFDTAEIIEMHHDAKADAPSGTAVTTANRMAAARTEPWADDPTKHEVYPGARGGEGPSGIRVHAVRMRGMIATQEVILGTTGQTLVVRHDTFDRASFMPGVVLACKKLPERAERFTIGLEPILGL